MKFFDAGKGYGFITPDDGTKDVFVSARTLGRIGLTALENNQRVRILVRMGCGEVVRVQEEKDGVRLWCLLYGSRPPYEGTVCAVITAEGGVLAHARACTAAKGLLQLFIPRRAPEKNESGPVCNESGQVQKESGPVPKEKNFAVRPGCLVCLRPPCSQSPPAPAS